MRASLLAVLGALTLVLAGCVHTTGGTAEPAVTPGPVADHSAVVPQDGLEKILLSVGDVNSIMGATDMDVVESSDEMGDSTADVSDPRCVGALYNAEDSVYANSGWTDLRDEVLTEPEGDSDHWVEQTAVKFASADRATDFFKASRKQWQECVGKTITVDDGSDQYDWRFGGLAITGTTLSQTASQSDSGDWSCQHALSAVGDDVVEVSACKTGVQDEALSIVGKLAANAA